VRAEAQFRGNCEYASCSDDAKDGFSKRLGLYAQLLGGIADSAANGLLQLTFDIAYGFVMETTEPAFHKAALYALYASKA
jgi:hypothetical protein